MEAHEVSDIVLFFGRFHPMILHLPIGFLLIAVALEMLSGLPQFRKYKPTVGVALALGAMTAVVAAMLGYMLAQAGGYNENLLSVHQWSGIAVAVFSMVAFLLYRRLQVKRSIGLHRTYLSVLSLMTIAMLVAGHFGGSLTHGSDYLTQHMPNNVRRIAGLPVKADKGFKKITNLAEAVVFTDIVQPILDARCNACHNQDKRKGELQMHTVEALTKGGENGPVLVAGNAAESEMIRRIHLAEIEEEHMPPSGKKQLSHEEIELLSWWINEGAPFDKKVAQVNAGVKIQDILNTLVDPDVNKTAGEILLASAIHPPAEQALIELERQGVQVKPVASGLYWLQANFSKNQSGDSLIGGLTQISEQLTWLDMRGTMTTDQVLETIANFGKLTRLHLENTQITDAGLQFLKNLPYLEYLNLYGTQVSDEGIQQLSGLKNLKTLFVWQTQVTKKGASQLKKVLPEVEIFLGLDNKQRDLNAIAEASVKN